MIFGTTDGPYEPWRPAANEQLRQSIDDIGGIELAFDVDHECLRRELINDVERAKHTAINGSGLN